MILTDEMLMAAFRYRETNLWELLDDSMVFAFQLSDDETGYCCVMGNAGEHLALGFYRGAKGFATYLNTISTKDMPQRELFEHYLTYDCINCDFMNAADASGLDKAAKARIRAFAKANGFKIRRPHGWPDFTRHSKHRVPRGLVDERDAQDITEALNAAVAVAEQLKTLVGTQSEGNLYDIHGFDPKRQYPTLQGGKEVPLLIPKGDGTYSWSTTKLPSLVKEEYERVICSNDIAVSRLKAMPHVGSTWECRLIHIPRVVNDPDRDTSFYPSLLLIVNANSDFVIPVLAEEPAEENPQAFLSELFTTLIRMEVCPATLHVCDERTQALLADFCAKTDIKMVVKSTLPTLNQVWDFMLMTL